jgi:hypothetical protein
VLCLQFVCAVQVVTASSSEIEIECSFAKKCQCKMVSNQAVQFSAVFKELADAHWPPVSAISDALCTIMPSLAVQLVQCSPDDEPVWRQLLQHYLYHPESDVAQEAAEGLDDSERSMSGDESQ